LSFTTRPELQGTFGMVASTHWLASAAGMAVLEKGGNAFDAAVAAGFVLQVVEPHLNGPGGDLPILLHSAAAGGVRAVCGQGWAPAGATIEHFQSQGLTMVPGTGLLAACVPGAFGAWLLLLRDYGTARLRDALEPAIGYAQHGYPVLPRISSIIASVEDHFRRHWPTSAAVYLAGGVPQPGTLHRNPDLAATYARLLQEAEAASGDRDGQIEHARQAWYEGWVAEAMERYVTRTEVLDVSGSPHAGVLTAQDMASWRATVEQPVHVDYADYRVFKCGPWSQGPVFLQQLSLLSGCDLGAMGLLSADYLHTVLESAKLAFADREAWYGDPDFVDVPLNVLLDAAYAAGRRRLIEPMASLELRPGCPDGLAPRIPEFVPQPSRVGQMGLGEAALGDPTVSVEGETRGDTCHVDVTDRFGNLVSATPSGGWLQSSPVIPGLGFCLGNRVQVFNLEPGHPNALAPRKRPRTTLSPSLAYRDGEPYIAFGTPGADQQDQWSLNFFLAYANSDLDLQQAIELPMFHTDHFPRSFYPHESFPGRVHVEDRIAADAVAGLRSRGHEVVVHEPWSLGRISAVARHPTRGLLAAANPRGGQGYAVGR
jgi:gamma-glutamyltranspeptidase/glutathione hydrolase